MPSTYDLIGSIILTDKATPTIRKVRSQAQGLQRELGSFSSVGLGGGGLFKDLLSGLESSIGPANAGLVGLVGTVGLVGAGFLTAKRSLELFQESLQQFAGQEQAEAFFRQFFGPEVQQNLQKLRDASLGLVSDFKLMAEANRAHMLGVAKDIDTLVKLLEVSTVRARAMGVSTSSALADIVLGIGRESFRILDNIGIVLKIGETMDRYAQQLGKTSDALTAAERKQAITNEIFRQSQSIMEDTAASVDILAVTVERRQAAWDNFLAALGEGVAPISKTLNQVATFALNKATAALSESPKEAISAWKELQEAVSDNREQLRAFQEQAESAIAILKRSDLSQSDLDVQIARWKLGISSFREELEKNEQDLQRQREVVEAYLASLVSSFYELSQVVKQVDSGEAVKTDDYYKAIVTLSDLQDKFDELKLDPDIAPILDNLFRELDPSAQSAAAAVDTASEALRRFDFTVSGIGVGVDQLQEKLDRLGESALNMASNFAVSVAKVTGNMDDYRTVLDEAAAGIELIGQAYVDSMHALGETPDPVVAKAYVDLQRAQFQELEQSAKRLADVAPQYVDEYAARLESALARANRIAQQLANEGQFDPDVILGVFRQQTAPVLEFSEGVQEVTRAFEELDKTAARTAGKFAKYLSPEETVQMLLRIKIALQVARVEYEQFLRANDETWDPDTWQLWVDNVTSRFDQLASNMGRSLTNAQSEAKRQAQKLRSIVSGALKPSDTGLIDPDEFFRVDALDEPARRMAAVARDGFKSEWVKPLVEQGLIPESVLQGGEEALRRFATDAYRQHIQGLSFGLFDKEAVKQRVRAQLEAEVQKEQLISEILSELRQEGLDVSRADVTTAFGGLGFGTALSQAMVEQVAEENPAGRALLTIQSQLESKQEEIVRAGRKVGGWFSQSFVEKFGEDTPTGLLEVLTVALLPRLIAALADLEDR